MTYNVYGGTLNLAQSNPVLIIACMPALLGSNRYYFWRLSVSVVFVRVCLCAQN